MKGFFLIIAAFFIVLTEGRSQGVVLNFDLDTTVWDIADPLNLWTDFLATHDDSLGALFWNSEEIDRFGTSNYFQVKKEIDFGFPNFLEFIQYGNMRIMSIRKRGEYFKISNIFSFTNESGIEDLYFMFHVYAGMENGELKLFNALKVNSEITLDHKKVGFLTYYYPKTHLFDQEKAEKQNKFLIKLAQNFDVPIVEVDYYFAETTEEIQEIKGFDYIFGDNGENMPTGKAYVEDKIVFTSGSGEYYPHEIIHVLLNPHFPNSHLWINEGVATYFGMSRGKELSWHLKKLKEDLRLHPDIDLSNMLSLRSMDASTDYRYVLGGYIVRCIFEEGGYPALKKAMNGGKSEEDFYFTIETHLGIKREDINAVIREKISRLKF